jgi:hypothetical protein
VDDIGFNILRYWPARKQTKIEITTHIKTPLNNPAISGALLIIARFHPHWNSIEAGAGRNKQSLHVLPAEADVSGPPFGNFDMIDLFAGFIKNRYAFPVR